MELKSTIQQLKNERGRVEKTVADLDHAIAVLEGLAGGTHVSAPAGARAGKRPPLSAAARKKISLAQKARWAKATQPQPQAVAHTRAPLSDAARKKISLAQKARWAKVAQQKQPQPPPAVAHKRPPLSAAARKKISLAQKARWAKTKLAQA